MHKLNSNLPINIYILAFFILTLTACSSIQRQQFPNDLTHKIEKARVVLVGETHTNYGHHLNQLAVIKKTHQKWGGVLSIGLEMVQQPFQQYLDDYIVGKISELEMLRGVQWYSRWRYDFRLYRPIFDFAKQHKIPLIALNIPQEITKRISKVGIDGLSPTERKQLPVVIDKSDSKYSARLKEVYSLHAHGKKFNESGFSKFVDAQHAWDEGMAFAASNYLRKQPNKRMVILAGSGHLINREGIPSRLDRQLEIPAEQRSIVILSHSDKKYSSEEADFSLKANEVTLPPAAQIGIGMEDTNSGVTISSVEKTGAAFKANLQEGDILLSLNQTRTKTASDVRLWLLDKKPNEKIKAVVRRNNKKLNKVFLLGTSNI